MRRGSTARTARTVGIAAALVGLALAAGIGAARAAGEAEWPPSSALPTGARTSTMAGWLDFCRRHREACGGGATRPAVIRLDAAARARIAAINRRINRTVRARSDLVHWGVEDRWDYPSDGFGDCEDFVLAKRRALIAAGFPRQALAVTVVRDGVGDGHAVLLARTDHGDYVLDHLVEAIEPWCATPYTWIKRQSDGDPDVWVTVRAGWLDRCRR